MCVAAQSKRLLSLHPLSVTKAGSCFVLGGVFFGGRGVFSIHILCTTFPFLMTDGTVPHSKGTAVLEVVQLQCRPLLGPRVLQKLLAPTSDLWNISLCLSLSLSEMDCKPNLLGTFDLSVCLFNDIL